VSAALEDAPVDLDEWIAEGERLGAEERSASSLMWRIGDWWNAGEPYGERAQIVTTAGWKGPAHKTCRNAGWVATRWPSSRRRDTLTFDHYAAVTALDDDRALALLDWAEEEGEDDQPRSTRDMRSRVKQVKRAQRETDLAGKIHASALAGGVRQYGVIYADPPWQYQPWSRETGMDRSADNHYPTMTLDELAALDLPAAADCVLFCWATVAMLPQALAFLGQHGFGYRSAYAWMKPGPGTGFWSTTDQIELLLVGTRGAVPAPAPGEQPPQTLTLPRSRHSEKPDAFADMIVRMFPTLPRLEMFARKERPDWDAWGAEAP
jgi:N6-adenosine-specific RNA methylase IME4